MKKNNLLSKAEMKKIIGGNFMLGGQDCSNTQTICPTGQVCCPFWDGSGPVTYSCEEPVLGPDGHTPVCPA